MRFDNGGVLSFRALQISVTVVIRNLQDVEPLISDGG